MSSQNLIVIRFFKTNYFSRRNNLIWTFPFPKKFIIIQLRIVILVRYKMMGQRIIPKILVLLILMKKFKVIDLINLNPVFLLFKIIIMIRSFSPTILKRLLSFSHIVKSKMNNQQSWLNSNRFKLKCSINLFKSRMTLRKLVIAFNILVSVKSLIKMLKRLNLLNKKCKASKTWRFKILVL